MIVVVEGPSAAGKTTWAEAHASQSLIPELRRDSEPPQDPAAAAAYWVQVHTERWSRAVELEAATGLAVFDTDPLKLHYPWSLWRISGEGETAFGHQKRAYRDALVAGRIGFADRFLVSIPDAVSLRARCEGDPTRRRRNFDVHARLAAPLRLWYAAIDQVRPGSVVWRFSEEALRPDDAQRDRYSVEDFDRLMELLSSN